MIPAAAGNGILPPGRSNRILRALPLTSGSVPGSRGWLRRLLLSFSPYTCLMMGDWQPPETPLETGVSQEANRAGQAQAPGGPAYFWQPGKTGKRSSGNKLTAGKDRQNGTAQITEWASFGKSDAKRGSNPPRSKGTAPWWGLGRGLSRERQVRSLPVLYLFTIHDSLFTIYPPAGSVIPAQWQSQVWCLAGGASSPGTPRFRQPHISFLRWHPGKTGPWWAESHCHQVYAWAFSFSRGRIGKTPVRLWGQKRKERTK